MSPWASQTIRLGSPGSAPRRALQLAGSWPSGSVLRRRPARHPVRFVRPPLLVVGSARRACRCLARWRVPPQYGCSRGLTTPVRSHGSTPVRSHGCCQIRGSGLVTIAVVCVSRALPRRLDPSYSFKDLHPGINVAFMRSVSNISSGPAGSTWGGQRWHSRAGGIECASRRGSGLGLWRSSV